MYLGWYLVRKECGNIYLDIDATTGSKVFGIRDGTATATNAVDSNKDKKTSCQEAGTSICHVA